MTTIRADTHGDREWARATDRVLARLMRANVEATADGQHIIERHVKRTLRRYSHPPGTPTPSPPGQPPAWVTGNLARSWRNRPVRIVRTWVAIGESGPTAEYARIQELGGRAGRGHAARLPRRPYVAPSVVLAEPEVRDGYRRRFTAVILATR